MADEREPPDHHLYEAVWFYPDTLRFFAAAAKNYESLLEREKLIVENDPHLAHFLTDEFKRLYKVGFEYKRAVRLRGWVEKKIADAPAADEYELAFDHGSARFLKSAGLLYLGLIKQRRNDLSREPNITSNLLNAIDRRVTTLEELLRSGVFSLASPLPLLAAQELNNSPTVASDTTAQESLATVARPKPVVIDSIEILDVDLRRRCLDLFTQFREEGHDDRYDTVVAEATRILEDRLRRITGTTDGVTGMELASRAFNSINGRPPRVIASEIETEQSAVHQLFRGVFGFIRNSVHHKLQPDLSPERVLQILGLIDYLISILNATPPLSAGPEVEL